MSIFAVYCADKRMKINMMVYVVGLLAFRFSPVVASCHDIQLEVSTTHQMDDGTNIAYFGRNTSTYIRCSVTCDACKIDYLMWRKDDWTVYMKAYQDDDSGPYPGYEGRVVQTVDDDAKGEYELEWKSTSWEDLPPGRAASKWSCCVTTSDCPFKEESIDVEYYSYPAHEAQVARGEEDSGDVRDATSRPVAGWSPVLVTLLCIGVLRHVI